MERLKKEYPHVAFIVNNQNLGFARGCNVGIREALSDRQCAYVLLLNNDAVVCNDSLLEAIEFAQSNARIGVISGKILLSEDPKILWYAGGRIDRWRGRAVVRGFSEIDNGQYETACEVGFATGALMLIKREVLEEVGLLPEEYFFGMEEWDFSLKVKRSGYKLFYVPQFVANHKADGSHWNYDPKFVYNSYRNKLIFQEKYLPKGLFPIWKIALTVYAKYLAKAAWQRLVVKYGFGKERAIPFEEMKFALDEAITDHRKNVLSEETLNHFDELLRNRRRVFLGPHG